MVTVPAACGVLELAVALCLGAVPLGLCRLVVVNAEHLVAGTVGETEPLLKALMATAARVVPDDLPRPPPGDVPGAVEHVLQWVNQSVGEDEVRAVVVFVLEDHNAFTLIGFYVELVQRETGGSVVALFEAIFPGPTPPAGAVCVNYVAAQGIAVGILLLLEDILEVDLPEDAIPQPCGPNGPDYGLGWLPEGLPNPQEP